ncbi:hypothetical protein P3574_24770 [Vibrio parahaemolyticus]|nr:hypothetical protein [Vibrio parahaemolyticus]
MMIMIMGQGTDDNILVVIGEIEVNNKMAGDLSCLAEFCTL